MTNKSECPACDGEGMWWSFPCDVCGGDGKAHESDDGDQDCE